jgi:hypothetical protein
MVAVDATTSVSTSRQRFLRCGLRNFHAGGDASHWHRSASRLARRSAALPHYSNSQLLTPSFSTPPFASEVYPDDHSGPTVIGVGQKSASSAQSVDQDSEPGIWNLEGPERAALPGMALHWLR